MARVAAGGEEGVVLGMVKVESFGTSDRGLRRHHNEDAFLVREDLGLFVVVDGMGGHAAGEVAAGLAVSEIEKVVEATQNAAENTWPEGWDVRLSCDANRLMFAALQAHRRVTGAVEGDPRLRGMGATMVAALLAPDAFRVTVAHVGDSRAYLLREGRLRLLTSDHSWVNEQVVAGLLSEDAARSHPLKNVVTRALGGAQEPVADVREHEIRVGDLLLLCSDGLNGMVADDDLADILRRGGSNLLSTARNLVDEANRRGGSDNITIVLVRIGEV